MMRRAVLTVALVLGLSVTAAPPAQAVTVPAPPTRVAALGDSITRAFDVNGSYFLKDAPGKSWATGDDGSVNSQVLRLRQKYYPASTTSPAKENDAVTGAKMSALAGQMATALTNGADYITVLMGANDVCTRTVSGSTGMTSTATFRDQFEAAMAKTDGKQVLVFVSSIPNVNRLYTLFSTSGSAKFAWSLYGVCQSLLSSRATPADRDAVAKQVVADNEVLQSVCAAHAATCAWDGGATYNVLFEKTDISTVDYFHPSVAGQNKLAGAAWTASPYAP
jgi:lysophospholipase L1-like esterase